MGCCRPKDGSLRTSGLIVWPKGTRAGAKPQPGISVGGPVFKFLGPPLPLSSLRARDSHPHGPRLQARSRQRYSPVGMACNAMTARHELPPVSLLKVLIDEPVVGLRISSAAVPRLDIN